MSNMPDMPPEEKPKPANGKVKPLAILTMIVLVAVSIGLVAYFLGRNREETDDAFIDGHIVEISPRVAAQVIAVHIDDNSEVRKGDVLVELDPRDFNVALEKAGAQLLQARAQVKQAEAGAAQAGAQLAQAKAEFAQRNAQFQIANIDFQRNSSLYQKDMRAVSKQDVDTTQTSMDAARATLDASSANVEAMQAAVDSARAQAGAAEASVKVAQTAVDDANLQLSYTRIVAPEAGRITRKNVEAGNYVQQAQTLFAIVSHNVWVTANFKETQLARMKVGQKVSIRVDAFPKRELRAHVESMQLGSGSRFSLLPAENATGNYVKVVQRVPVKIVFDEPLDVLSLLGPGMSVQPTVDLSSE